LSRKTFHPDGAIYPSGECGLGALADALAAPTGYP